MHKPFLFVIRVAYLNNQHLRLNDNPVVAQADRAAREN
jgi:hypothetical protein